MPDFIDLTGQRFTRLTVIKRAPRTRVQVTWICRCDCGNTLTVMGQNLRRQNTMSCGCLQKERAGGQPKHGGYKTRLAGIWYHMRYRCLTPTCNAWPRYGGRGIKLCKDWHEFVPFRDWALANGYADNLTIDRIDNNGNYEPSNCQWISRADNTRKKRKKP